MKFATKALYMNPLVATTTDDFFYLVDIINRSELNAIVVDVKENGVYVDTSVELFREANAVTPILDVDGMLRTLQANDIYAIARLVVFKDDHIASTRPDLAGQDRITGKPWVDFGDGLWLDPFKREIWDAAAAYALELAQLGFQEIQFDYVRFPSDGDLARMDFGREIDESARVDAICGFLGFCRDQLTPMGVATAADVFGYTYLLDGIGIGQNAARIAEMVDVVCPMAYPSHYPLGSINVPGHPNDFPYETVAITIEAGAARVDPRRTRPWLQDFSISGLNDYGEGEVRAQIEACNDAGTSGWMVWDPNNRYHAMAFRPEA